MSLSARRKKGPGEMDVGNRASLSISPVFQNSLLWAGSGLTWLSLCQDQVCLAAATGDRGRAVNRGQRGGGSGRAHPWPQPSSLLALTRNGAGMDSETQPRQAWGLSPSPHLSPAVSQCCPPRSKLPWWVSHLRLGCPSCAGTGALAEAGLGFWPHVLSAAGLGVFHRHRAGVTSKEGPLFPPSAESPGHSVPQQH